MAKRCDLKGTRLAFERVAFGLPKFQLGSQPRWISTLNLRIIAESLIECKEK